LHRLESFCSEAGSGKSAGKYKTASPLTLGSTRLPHSLIERVKESHADEM
jgi:hypothetical protein